MYIFSAQRRRTKYIRISFSFHVYAHVHDTRSIFMTLIALLFNISWYFKLQSITFYSTVLPPSSASGACTSDQPVSVDDFISMLGIYPLYFGLIMSTLRNSKIIFSEFWACNGWEWWCRWRLGLWFCFSLNEMPIFLKNYFYTMSQLDNCHWVLSLRGNRTNWSPWLAHFRQVASIF